MFKNYFKIAFRNFRKHKIYSIINLAGLGMAHSEQAALSNPVHSLRND